MSAEPFFPGDGFLSIEDRRRIEDRLSHAEGRGDTAGTWMGIYAKDVRVLLDVLKLRRPIDANTSHVGAAHPVTARTMDRKVMPRSGSKRRMVYDWVAGRGDHGATAEEVGDHFGWGHQSYSAVVSNLVRDGWLVPAAYAGLGVARTRPTRAGNDATVYRATT